MNKGADLHISGALAFEVPIEPLRPWRFSERIRGVSRPRGRDKRRKALREFLAAAGL